MRAKSTNGNKVFWSELINAPLPREWKPEAFLEHTGEEWRREAACIGAPPEIFDLIDTEDSALTISEGRKINEQNFERAKEYCLYCPVSTACRVDAIENGDLAYTVRGGHTPYDLERPIPADPARFSSLPQNYPRAWDTFLRGKSSNNVRRAGNGPLRGPWPEWEGYVLAKLEELPRVAWKRRDGNREAWILRPAEPGGTEVYLLVRRGDSFERKTAHPRDLRAP